MLSPVHSASCYWRKETRVYQGSWLLFHSPDSVQPWWVVCSFSPFLLATPGSFQHAHAIRFAVLVYDVGTGDSMDSVPRDAAMTNSFIDTHTKTNSLEEKLMVKLGLRVPNWDTCQSSR